jgi:hypothetical protein
MSSKPARKPASASQSTNPFTILSTLSSRYAETTPSRTKLIDAFLAFLVLTGITQFLYCVVAGNYVCPSPREKAIGKRGADKWGIAI